MNKEEFYEALNRNREYALEHWGIKGQKWGIRRYQNPDGTLTEEGKKHYGRKVMDETELQAIHEVAREHESKKADRAIGAALGATYGGLVGALGGGIKAGTPGAIAGGVSGVVAGGLLGLPITYVAGKLQDRSYQKSVTKVNNIIAKYGDEEVDGQKIKALAESHKNDWKEIVNAYYDYHDLN